MRLRSALTLQEVDDLTPLGLSVFKVSSQSLIDIRVIFRMTQSAPMAV